MSQCQLFILKMILHKELKTIKVLLKDLTCIKVVFYVYFQEWNLKQNLIEKKAMKFWQQQQWNSDWLKGVVKKSIHFFNLNLIA